jgi:hypothetical protein
MKIGVFLTRPLSASASASAAESRGFHYYLYNTGPKLSGYYDPSFWEELIVQAAVAEPAARHAIIGIGALHGDFMKELHHNSTGRFATIQYTKAVRCLKQSLAVKTQEPLAVLLTCILLITFDNMRSDFASAIVSRWS